MAVVTDTLKLFLAGDVMTARGIDSVLPHPGDPRLYEAYVKNAGVYVQLAERLNGSIPHPVDFTYVWGDALDEFGLRQPQVRIINLETAVSRHGRPEQKGINYRMSPENFPAISAAGIDCCVLANNHVLDWGTAGLAETLDTLSSNGMCSAGAGHDRQSAEAPAVLPQPGGRRLLVYGLGTPDSGIPPDWVATDRHAGVARLEDLSRQSLRPVAKRILEGKSPGDLVVASIHWGGNWGFDIPQEQVRFAHALIDKAGVDLVHGHSSHHIKGIEVYREHLILYGCGDLLNDYEGIEGHTAFRGDLGLMYFAALDPSGRLQSLDLIPTRLRRFRICRAEGDDRQWLHDTLSRECARLGCSIQLGADNAFALRW
ncbi:CapA family protein [Pseudomonas cavernicola]|uniref:CapA family protein n=1 Tax=Pseudomonas cavernicola TaxID=2320866 RepID=A0A418XK54_9PSED|nr:CapA family protein [Pseudomonas cavernicola]RJG12816.1 CapA family protein [Pseudomonas cavernicola]